VAAHASTPFRTSVLIDNLDAMRPRGAARSPMSGAWSWAACANESVVPIFMERRFPASIQFIGHKGCYRQLSRLMRLRLSGGKPRSGRALRMCRGGLSEPTYNTLMGKFNIFLSHITVESRLADLIKRHLVRDFIGLVEVFESSDRLSIPAGAKWLTEVMEGLQRANLHLILCSQDATSRPWIQFEAGAAHLRQIPIVPLCHGGLTCAQLPVPLSEYEGIQASEPEGLVALYRAIANALGSSVPEIDFHAFVSEVNAFEAEYTKEKDLTASKVPFERVVERIRDPKALCISSPQFATLGFENQL
jgi:hypothetical protein